MFIFALFLLLIMENLQTKTNKKGKERGNTVPEQNVIICDVSDYTTTSRQSLNIQNLKAHFKEFRAMCDICEKVSMQ